MIITAMAGIVVLFAALVTGAAVLTLAVAGVSAAAGVATGAADRAYSSAAARTEARRRTAAEPPFLLAAPTGLPECEDRPISEIEASLAPAAAEMGSADDALVFEELLSDAEALLAENPAEPALVGCRAPAGGGTDRANDADFWDYILSA